MKLILISLLPGLLFLGTLSVLLAKQKLEVYETTVSMTSTAISAAIDQKINSIISALEILMVTEGTELRGQDLKDLHKRLRKAVAGQPAWISIAFITPDGNQVFNTLKEFGEPIPNISHLDFFQRAMETGAPVVSGLRMGLITKAPIISIVIPIKRKGKITNLLLGSLNPDALNKILVEQNLNKGWVAALIDRDGKIIARSRYPEKFQGQTVTNELKKRILAGKDGLFEDVNLEGTPSLGALRRSPLTKWSVAVEMMASESHAVFYNTLWLVFLGGGLFLTLGFFMAYYFSRQISAPIYSLAKKAKALGDNHDLKMEESPIQEIQEVSKALSESAMRSRKAIEMRETFLSVASHELKTPLTALLLTIKLIQREIGSDCSPQVLARTEKALAQIDRLGLLIDELLDVSRLSSGKLSLNLKETRLDELAQDVLSQFEDLKPKLELHPVSAKVDPCRIEQIILNLITNAQKYGDGNDVVIKIWEDDHHAYFSISDKGPGVHEEYQERIFQKFDQGQEGSRKSGLGLGLWICRQIALLHGGFLGLESAPGEGATFTLTLPKQAKQNN